MKNSDDIPKRVGKFISIICLGTIISLNSCSSTKDTKTVKTGLSENVIIDYLRGGNNYRQCQRHSSNMVLHELRSIGRKGEGGTPFWRFFCNPKEQAPEKIQICHIKYSDHSVPGLKNIYPVIYGDSTKWNNDKIPYCDADARWYLVTLDKDPVFLRLEGTGNFTLITGIINPAMNIAYCEKMADIIPRMGL